MAYIVDRKKKPNKYVWEKCGLKTPIKQFKTSLVGNGNIWRIRYQGKWYPSAGFTVSKIEGRAPRGRKLL